jgi:hypothetical protein
VRSQIRDDGIVVEQCVVDVDKIDDVGHASGGQGALA